MTKAEQAVANRYVRTEPLPPSGIAPFPTIAVAKSYGLLNTDGPYSFLAVDRDGSAKRFTHAPDANGLWGIAEVTE